MKVSYINFYKINQRIEEITYIFHSLEAAINSCRSCQIVSTDTKFRVYFVSLILYTWYCKKYHSISESTGYFASSAKNIWKHKFTALIKLVDSYFTLFTTT